MMDRSAAQMCAEQNDGRLIIPLYLYVDSIVIMNGLDKGPQIGRNISFLTAWFCPFAQRTWIALNEKKLNFEVHEVAIKDPETGLWKQLNEKPEWFLKLNPLGKVPVLAYRDNEDRLVSVYESIICNEFLEDYAPHPEYPPLFPLHPGDKASARLIIDRFDRKFIPNFYGILSKKGDEQRKECGQIMTTELLWLESEADPEGPYFLGKQFGAVDATILPYFIRLYILKHYRGFEMPKECKRLVAWQMACEVLAERVEGFRYKKAMERESVQATMQCPEEDAGYEGQLLEHYSKYADGTANSTSARDFGGQ